MHRVMEQCMPIKQRRLSMHTKGNIKRLAERTNSKMADTLIVERKETSTALN